MLKPEILRFKSELYQTTFKIDSNTKRGCYWFQLKISQKLKETGFILISSNGHRKTGPNGVDGEKPKLPITK